MAQDPRKFLQDACGPVGNPNLAQTRKSGFFGTLGKIGDLEILNEVDTRIGEGLRALETVANQVRTGLGAPNIFKSADTSQEAGEDAVITTVGIDANTTRGDGVRFNPAVANRALGTAKQIFNRVREGNFEIKDVPEALQDFGALGQLLGGIFTPLAGEDGKDNTCDPSPYARDLIALAPKHKFMFVVEFVFAQQFQALFNNLDFAFVVKRSTRPIVNFEYEDINYYNFRTKVLKRSEYQPMSMTFYDDILDNALRFYNTYLQLISPISRTHGQGTNQFFEETGMSFDTGGAPNSSSTQAVGDVTRTIIDHVNLFHLIHAGREVDVYRFENPRLQTLTLDELDMTDGSAGTEVTIEFNYDGLLIEPKIPIELIAKDLKELTTGGVFPINPRLSGAGAAGTAAAIFGNLKDTFAKDIPGIDTSTTAPPASQDAVSQVEATGETVVV